MPWTGLPWRPPGAKTGVSFLGGALPVKLVTVGESLTIPADSYANLYKTANPGLAYQMVAASGRAIGTRANLNDGGPTHFGNFSTIMGAAGSVYTLLIGAADLGSVADETEWLNRAKALVADIKAARPGVSVLVSTVLPRAGIAGNTASQTYANTHNSRRAIVNPLIRSGAGDWHDGVIPLGDHPVAMTDAAAADPTYFSDEVHPTSAAQAAIAPIYAAVMDPLFANASGANPAAFAMTAVNNATVSTVYTSRFIVTGMGRTASATASVSGAGDFSRGQLAYGTGAQTVVNGDFISVRETSSSSGNTAVSTTVSIGTRSATFTVTTAAANPLVWTSSPTLLTTSRGSASATPATHAADFTAGRQLLYIAKNGVDPTTVTIDGVAATKIGQTSGGGSATSVWMSGQTLAAGNYPVSIGGVQIQYMSVLYGAVSGGSIASTAFAARALASHNGSTAYPATAGSGASPFSLTVATGGIMVAFSHQSTPATAAFANSTADRSFTGQPGATGNAAGSALNSATSTTSQTPTVTWSAFVNGAGFVAVSLAQ